MHNLNRLLSLSEEYIASSLLIFTSLLVFVQVVLRYLFNYSLFWSEEIARFLIIWFIFIGSSIAVRDKAHISVDVVVQYLPGIFKKVIPLLASFLCIVFSGIIILSGWKMIQNVAQFDIVSPALELPLIYAYLAIPLGSFLMLIRFVQDFFDKSRDLAQYLSQKKDKTERS